MQPRTDKDLIEANADSGDESAFAELVSRYQPLVYRTCLRLLRDAHEAEDAAQAAFVVLARKAGKLRQEGRLNGWLHRVARNVGLYALERRADRERQKDRIALLQESVVVAGTGVVVAQKAMEANPRPVSNVASVREDLATKVRTPKHPVNVKLASLLGGSGTEWFCGAAFQPNGSLVLCGTALGPELSVAGTIPRVLGTDGPVPVSKKNADPIASVTWERNEGAPFLTWLDPAMTGVTRVVRLPWGTGSACGMACDEKGDIYIAGKIGSNLNAVAVFADVTVKDAETKNEKVFVVKLTGDGSQVLWGRRFEDAGQGIKIRYHGGILLVEGQWAYAFNPDGAVVRTIRMDKSKGIAAVNPVDGTVAYARNERRGAGKEPLMKPCIRLEFAPKTKKETGRAICPP